MDDFEYVRPGSLTEACDLLSDYGHGAKVLSGGQSLLPMLRQRVAAVDCVIDINDLPDRDYVTLNDGSIEIGCLTRYVTVAGSEVVEDNCRLLADAVEDIGDKQVRNRGTVCGSIAHADPAGDPPVVATALEAEIVATSADGTNTYAADSFFEGLYETALDPNEIVSEVRFPVVEPPRGAAYAKYEPSAGAYPVATVASVLELDGDRVADARIVAGAVEAGPTRLPTAEAEIEGEEPTDEAITAAAEAAGGDVDPMDDAEGSAEFKSEMTKTLAKRSLQSAADRAEGED